VLNEIFALPSINAQYHFAWVERLFVTAAALASDDGP
jgi:hypothetical protein